MRLERCFLLQAEMALLWMDRGKFEFFLQFILQNHLNLEDLFLNKINEYIFSVLEAADLALKDAL